MCVTSLCTVLESLDGHCETAMKDKNDKSMLYFVVATFLMTTREKLTKNIFSYLTHGDRAI